MRQSGRLISVFVAAVAVAVIFGAVLPRFASYREVWETVASLDGGALVLITLVGVWNLFTYWPALVLALPGLRLREAAVVNTASTAVTNTVPAGSAVAVGVTARMLRTWGFTGPSITNQIVLTGVLNQLTKLVMPLVAIALLAVAGEFEGQLVEPALWGLGCVAVFLACAAVTLRNEQRTARFAATIGRTAAWFVQALHLRRSPDVAQGIVETRRHLIEVMRSAGVWLAVAVVISHLSLYLVLLSSLRAVGVGADSLSWSKILVGFAVVRLLSSVPVTPGGLGIVELGYVGFLATGDASALGPEVTAAVLLFRAVTFAVPVVLGMFAWAFFLTADGWRRPSDTRGRALDTTPIPVRA